MKPKVIAFDVFGTVFDLSGVNREEIRAYVEHIRQPEWKPLELPEQWASLHSHHDAHLGIAHLRDHYDVVTLTNGPVRLITKLSKFNGIEWDAIVPIELRKVYKPNLDAYRMVMELFQCEPGEVMMVTANQTFGDIEAAKSLGMQWYWIDRKNGATVWSVLEALGH